MRIARSILLVLFTAAVLTGTWLMLRLTLPYLSFRYDVDFLLTKQSVLHVDIWRWAFYTHISTSIFVLFFGIFQFSKYIQIRYTAWHRAMGKMYVFLVLALSAPSGFIMALYANGGIWAKVSFIMISLLWWFFTWKAYADIRRKKIVQHRANMIRSYALTLSALTLRTYVLLLPMFLHLHGREMYVLVAWMSWVPNLVIGEVIIRRKWMYRENIGMRTGKEKILGN